GDAYPVGAAWIFVRSGTTWSQVGAKLVGTGGAGDSQQGAAVALSGDGNTAIVGGRGGSQGTGASWIFLRRGGAWIQQQKLVGAGAAGPAFQGSSVALSSDGNTAVIGGPGDNNGMGAIWVFVRSGGVWAQQGAKITGSGEAGAGALGTSVSVSGDG